MTPVTSSPLTSLALTKSSVAAVAQISVVCNLILGRHPQARLARSTGGRSGRWTQPAATGNQTIMWEVACWAGHLTGRPSRFVSGFLCSSRAGSRSDQDCCHRDLQTNARQLMWGSAWEGAHRSPELLLSVAEVSAGVMVRCHGMVSPASGGCYPLQSMARQRPEPGLRSQGSAREWQSI